VAAGGRRHVLLTGATGYVGGRLLRALEREDVALRCIARRPGQLRERVAAATEVIAGDLLDDDALRAALEGIDTAYYLVHSMSSAAAFAELDRDTAERFGRAARSAGVSRIIYLGGLGGGGTLSSHLASRQEVGQILRRSGVETIEFRASIIIGSGSLSFEMIRALVERLPVMVTPRWVRTLTQPIAIEDVIDYLLAALDAPAGGGRVYEIGGADVVSYGDIMQAYATRRGLRRVMIGVPLLTPRLSSLWLSLVTPLYAQVGRKLVDGVRNETVVTDDAALRDFPLRPRGVGEAIDRALAYEDHEFAQTRWSDALSAMVVRRQNRTEYGSRLIDSRAVRVAVPPGRAFSPIARIGGATGWYGADALWRLRGVLDQVVGGVGLRRGRRSPDTLAAGDTLDFWTVEDYQPGKLLRLEAQMRVPGRAWLQFEVEPDGEGARIRQTALFDPAGVAGRAYWYALYPLHMFVFRRMLRGIARAAVRGHSSST
jgi:uncharacterized protein YbjT (DUF2867 family)